MSDLSSSYPNRWLLFDHSKSHLQASQALAYEDALIRWLPQINQTDGCQGQRSILHLYPLEQPTVLLGAKDSRLSQFKEGIHFLNEAGYQTCLRPHGGLAVVCDPGVTNFSLIHDQSQLPLSIDQAYEQMVDLVSRFLAGYGLQVQAYEISQSYCPGRYDLVVEGRKIGGLAQRRFKDGVTCAAYLSVTGPQDKRADLIKCFYQIGQADASYPNVEAQVMASLSEFIPQPFSVTDFNQQLIQFLAQSSLLDLRPNVNSTLQTLVNQMEAKIQARNTFNP
ncbi:lipoate--protein ligase family protein [Vaginisenegalia massiliensis]|uniref:lipoate--protein ligase family protein n=1 Tax=Vaginisenegalia massiliensis TaxID=2058294 RepID=UPI000F52A62C|nr:hypothetical protein [Vaginisenegalia massiliensis]